jgi:hypothetical protein
MRDEFLYHKKQLKDQIKRYEAKLRDDVDLTDRQQEILSGIIERKKQALKENRVY